MASECAKIRVNAIRAISWLGTIDTLQRPLSNAIVEAYKEDMLAGDYHDNGSTIVFYGPLIDGEVVKGETELGDGQHRLWGVIEAAGQDPDFDVEFLVVWNVDRSAAASIDAGRPRSYAHHKKILQQSNISKVPTLVRRVYNWDKGYRMPAGTARAVLTNPGINRIYQQDQAAYDTSLKQGARLATKFDVNRSGASIAYHLFARIDKKLADQYYEDIIGWQRIGKPGHPVLALVETFAKRDKAQRSGILPLDPTLILLILCWNNLRQGTKHRARFVIKDEYYTNNEFPVPVVPSARPVRTTNDA